MQSPGTEQLPCSSLQPRLQIAREEKIENWDQNLNISNHLFCAWIANDCISRIKNCFVKFQTFFTISAFPSTQANLVSAFTACIMAKLIVTWPTKCRTRGVEIIFRALHTNATQKPRNEKSNQLQSTENKNYCRAFAARARPMWCLLWRLFSKRSHRSLRWTARELNSHWFIYTILSIVEFGGEKRKKELTDTLSAHFYRYNSMYSIPMMVELHQKTRLHQSVALTLRSRKKNGFGTIFVDRWWTKK